MGVSTVVVSRSSCFDGLIFVPWMTLMYVLVAPGGITGFDWLWLSLMLIGDIASYGGGGYGNRDRIPV